MPDEDTMNQEAWTAIRELLPEGMFIATVGDCPSCGETSTHAFWGWRNVECLNCGHERWVEGGTLQPIKEDG